MSMIKAVLVVASTLLVSWIGLQVALEILASKKAKCGVLCDPPVDWCLHGATNKFKLCGGVPGYWCTDSKGHAGFLACTGTSPAGTAWPHGTCPLQTPPSKPAEGAELKNRLPEALSLKKSDKKAKCGVLCDPPADWCLHGATNKFKYCGGVPGNWCTDTKGQAGFLACTGTSSEETRWPHGTCSPPPSPPEPAGGVELKVEPFAAALSKKKTKFTEEEGKAAAAKAMWEAKAAKDRAPWEKAAAPKAPGARAAALKGPGEKAAAPKAPGLAPGEKAEEPKAPREKVEEPKAPGKTPEEPKAPGKKPEGPKAPGKKPEEPKAPGKKPEAPLAPGKKPEAPLAPGKKPETMAAKVKNT